MEISLAALICQSRWFGAAAVLLSLVGLSLALCSCRAFWLMPFFTPVLRSDMAREKESFAPPFIVLRRTPCDLVKRRRIRFCLVFLLASNGKMEKFTWISSTYTR